MIAFASELLSLVIWVTFLALIAGLATLGWGWGARLREHGWKAP
jgi:hypothetical protein